LARPAPYVLQPELHDYYIRYEICAYTNRPTELHLIETSLRRKMQEHLFADGIEICSPAFFALRDGNAVQLPKAAQEALAGNANDELAREYSEAEKRSFLVKVDSQSE
jgi:small-conductance mechanosensitive channel